ncbi:hypothetical protein Bca52824_035941 [Brassica carinata]|uniref:Uncharacterized protein n=1 Tax=Brassica carinata TaxID=52824 RepID=A0A8X7S8F5_BRACI|nr:hypothetical protein Bca52824_035941 [Brassica carinata]
MQRQQKEADEKLKRQAMDAKIKALNELKEDQSNAEKTRGQASTRIPEIRPKSNSSDNTNASRASRDDDFKVISDQWKMSEESYDISPYKCSDDEDEDKTTMTTCLTISLFLHGPVITHLFTPKLSCLNSKSNILPTVISQQNRDPDITFPAKSFRNITQGNEEQKP